jgi:hypothetical protein
VNPLVFFARRRRLRSLAVWLMIALVPMHALAASVLVALGPLHTHAAAPSVAVLDDVRRVSSHPSLAPRHVATAFGHFHAGAAERHRHPSGDASVHVVGDSAAAALDADASSTAALAAIVAVPEAGVEWRCEPPGGVRPAHTGWVPQMHVPEPFERPPRTA